MTLPRTYLDHNASQPLRREARAAMLQALDDAGNPSSVHAEGRRARSLIEGARDAVAGLAGARAADVVFTSGASEANATVLAGGWRSIYLSALEHDSVRSAAKRANARVIDVPVTTDGQFDVAAFDGLCAQATASEPALVCLQMANNETGVIQPVAAVAGIAKARGLRLHSDAVQAPGRLAIDCRALGVDYLSLSAHKMGGPKGAGALIVVDGAPLPPLIAGGGQERGRRAGTENLAGIAGFGAAARLAAVEVSDTGGNQALRDLLEEGVSRLTPSVVIVGKGVQRLANTSSLALAGLAAETIVIRMDLAGVAISAGAACSSGKVGQSATLMAMKLAPDVARAAVRVSVGHGNSAADIDAFLSVWASLAASMRRAA